MLSWLACVVTIANLAGAPPVASDTAIRDTVRTDHPVVVVRDSVALATPLEASLTMAMTSEMVLDERLRSAPLDHGDFFVLGDSIAGDTTQASRRPRAIEYSDAYHTRLKIHQIGAYLMIPLFISEYVLGEKLLTSTNRSNGLKTAHSAVAAGVGVVFVANTVTGAWNFWDARKDPNGRARRESTRR